MQRLLIVEDDIIICGGLKTFLEARGYEVHCAYNFAEAKKALEKSYQLVILDSNLPDGDGVEFCQEIRKERQGGQIRLKTTENGNRFSMLLYAGNV